ASEFIATAETERAQRVMKVLGLELLLLYASTPDDLDAAFATLTRRGAGALVVGGDLFFVAQRDRLAALAIRHGVPAIYAYRVAVSDGGLMSYNVDPADAARLAGTYVGRILKGEKPSELPVQQPTKVELVLNLKTAKALGLTFRTALLVRADEVIE